MTPHLQCVLSVLEWKGMRRGAGGLSDMGACLVLSLREAQKFGRKGDELNLDQFNLWCLGGIYV